MSLVLEAEILGEGFYCLGRPLVLGVRSRPDFEPVTRAPLCAWPPQALLGRLPMAQPMWLPAGRGRKLQVPSSRPVVEDRSEQPGSLALSTGAACQGQLAPLDTPEGCSP